MRNSRPGAGREARPARVHLSARAPADAAVARGDARRHARARSRRGGCRSSRTGGAATASTRWSRSATSGRDERRDARRSTPTASSSRSTTSRCASGSARRRSFRAGRPRSSSRPSRRRRGCCSIEVNVGRTGAVTPYAVLEPVFARRLDDLDGDAAQRARTSRARTSATATRVRHREGRRRHPEGRRRRCSSRRAGGRRAVGDADRRARSAAARCSAPRTRSSGAARTRRARRGCAAASSTSRRARAMNIEGLGESLIDQLVDAGPGAATSPTCTTRARALRRRSSRARAAWGKKSAANAASAQIERSKRQRPVAADLRPRHPPRRREAARRRWRGAFGSMDAHRGGAGRGAAGGAGHRAGASPRRCARSPTSRATATLVDRLAAAGVQHGRARPPRAGGERPARWPGKTFVLTGTLDVDDARGGGRGASSALGGKVVRLGQQEDDVSWSSGADAGQQAREGARSSACRTLDEAGVPGAYNENVD